MSDITAAVEFTEDSNADLTHSKGGSTTRDDLHDMGAPMMQGSPNERVGPEDALGEGAKRGDYTNRVDPRAHTSVPLPGGGEPITKWVTADGRDATPGAKGATEITVDYKPRSAVRAQAPRAEDIGDAGPVKGGVDTDPASPIGAALANASSGSASALTADDLTADELQAIAKGRGEPTSGSKADIIGRLKGSDQTAG